MAHLMQRSRSSHSIRSINRPLSRASTMSAASPAPELLPSDMQYAQQHFMTSGPEAALLQYAGAQNGNGMVDPLLQHQLQQQAMQGGMEQFHQRPYTPQDGQYMMQDPGFGAAQMSFPPAMAPGVEQEDRRRKNSAATATNDKELRELLARNENRILKDVAQEVIQKERTPQAEKTKQLFAMLWLRKVCKPAKTSVPRNRVYSHYATRCGTERVVPLNPASFGKLVRVIFPGIQTRRLGVRGESKYHYVDLALQDEDSEPAPNMYLDSNDFRRSASVGASLDFGSMPRLPGDTAAFPSNDASIESKPTPQPEPRGPPSHGRLFAYPDSRGMLRENEGSLMYEQTLRFPSQQKAEVEEDDSIALPSIHPYCPPKTDPDTAEALVALYRTHCTSLIDCIRFCKEKQFFRLFTSFHGTLTVPVQKLFSHPNLATWIQECDYLMYQKMVRFVSRLTLQAAPPIVITILNNISTNLHAHISKTFQAHPTHVLQAKLKPAATFASLLHRLIRVNAAAHAAANLLITDSNREQMWREWVTMVNPKRVMEGELPDCGYDEVYKILTCDIRSLLEPLNSPPFPDNPIFMYDNQAYGNGQSVFSSGYQNNEVETTGQDGQVSTENVLDRWATFLTGLPARFPQASTRTMLHCISAVGTAALRDITIMGGASYQTWWVMKIFVDEMAHWLSAMGGFIERTPSVPKPSAVTTTSTPVVSNGELHNSTRSGSASRTSSAEEDFSQTQDLELSQPQQNGISAPQLSRSFSTHSMQSGHNHTQTFDLSMSTDYSQEPQHSMQQRPQQPQRAFSFDDQLAAHHQQLSRESQQQQFQPKMSKRSEADIDDSGICMSYLDDDLTFAKFGMTGAHMGHDLIGGEMGVNVI